MNPLQMGCRGEWRENLKCVQHVPPQQAPLSGGVLKELNAEIIRIMAQPDMVEFMRKPRLQVYPPHSAEQFARQIRSELEGWRRVAKAARVEAQ